ncbi:MAG: helix-turn-helix domain-containing protein [Thermoplasmatota archaeon]
MVQLRALGYGQTEIARQLGVSQGTVSRYLAAVNKSAREADDQGKFLLGLIAVAAGIGLLAYLLRD